MSKLRAFEYQLKPFEEAGYAIGVAFLVAAVGVLQQGSVADFMAKPSDLLILAAAAGGRAAVVAFRVALARLVTSPPKAPDTPPA